MAKSSKRSKWCFTLFRFLAVCLFTGGFIYQTMQFLFLYWTYPTVVDIQQISPSYLEIPAFTFCNPTGYIFDNICNNIASSGLNPCPNSFFAKMAASIICKQYPYICYNGTLPKGFMIILYGKFMQEYALKRTDFSLLALPLEEYLTCTIEFAGAVESCDMDNVLGSLYSTDDLPQFCFTIYSKWGKPNKEQKLIPKGATMKFQLFLNLSRRLPVSEGYDGPMYNPPAEPSVQIAVHSPYFLPSPILEGSSFLGGKAYEMRIKLRESHLMPLPYQTNCTDYMSQWYQRGGKGPVHQLSLIQECRVNKTYEAIGCIPLSIDYPHAYNICKACKPDQVNCPYVEPPNKCTLLADSYNQPCDSMVYEVEKEDKVIVVFKKIESTWAAKSDGFRITMTEHDCEGKNAWKIECSTIDIDIPFDRFEITNITYNPKFESLELFSVIGGYMGMWLGISLLTVFDLIGDAFVQLKSFLEAGKKKKRARMMKVVAKEDHQNFPNEAQKFHAPHYNNVW